MVVKRMYILSAYYFERMLFVWLVCACLTYSEVTADYYANELTVT